MLDPSVPLKRTVPSERGNLPRVNGSGPRKDCRLGKPLTTPPLLEKRLAAATLFFTLNPPEQAMWLPGRHAPRVWKAVPRVTRLPDLSLVGGPEHQPHLCPCAVHPRIVRVIHKLTMKENSGPALTVLLLKLALWVGAPGDI